VSPVRPAAGASLAAAALAALLSGCGVKAPPRPPGAPEKPAAHDTLQPAREPRP
jgi:hypothetical protein